MSSVWSHQKALSLVLAGLALSGCPDRVASTQHMDHSSHRLQAAPLAARQESPVDLRELIAVLIQGRDTTPGAFSKAERSQLEAVYQPGHVPLWVDAAGRPTPNLRDAIVVLSDAAGEGLDPGDYYQALVTSLMPRLEAATASAEDLARLDVAVSAGLLRYLQDVHMGRVDPRAIGFRLASPRDQHDFVALLRDAVTARHVPELANDLLPRLEQYRLLRSVLPLYRSLAADASLSPLQPVARAVHPGQPYDSTVDLLKALIAFGDLPADVAPVPEAGRYEGRIVEGVRHFQKRHGLEPDGVLGKSTIGALRVPPAWRVRQIELALERIRWLPHFGDERLIALNIPMFRLWAWDTASPNGMPRFGMDAIVGRAVGTQTPILSAEMGEVIFRPYWNVPPSILRHEVLPKIEADPDYLRREEMEIVRGAGDNASRVELTGEALAGLRQGLLRVRQRPGAMNALGLIKFVFPNREDVYMHGTPAQALFGRSRRDFSHGCVRVADPVALAEWVLRDRPEWTRERIVGATTGTPTVHVKLPRPITVILFYTTAAVMPEDGTMHFAEDIYGHDAALDRALAARGRAQRTGTR